MENIYQIRSVPRMFEEVTRAIVNYIQTENLKKGVKLPPERKLSELLGVSRSSVREAIRILEMLGYLESKQGGGTFVSQPEPFLIPVQIVSQYMDKQTLKKYFEMALLNAEKIISLSIELDHAEPILQIRNTDFWEGFSEWINVLGSQLENDYYLKLWNNIFPMLAKQGFLDELNIGWTLQDLLIAFQNKNKKQLDTFLSQLIKGAASSAD